MVLEEIYLPIIMLNVLHLLVYSLLICIDLLSVINTAHKEYWKTTWNSSYNTNSSSVIFPVYPGFIIYKFKLICFSALLSPYVDYALHKSVFRLHYLKYKLLLFSISCRHLLHRECKSRFPKMFTLPLLSLHTMFSLLL